MSPGSSRGGRRERAEARLKVSLVLGLVSFSPRLVYADGSMLLHASRARSVPVAVTFRGAAKALVIPMRSNDRLTLSDTFHKQRLLDDSPIAQPCRWD